MLRVEIDRSQYDSDPGPHKSDTPMFEDASLRRAPSDHHGVVTTAHQAPERLKAVEGEAAHHNRTCLNRHDGAMSEP